MLQLDKQLIIRSFFDHYLCVNSGRHFLALPKFWEMDQRQIYPWRAQELSTDSSVSSRFVTEKKKSLKLGKLCPFFSWTLFIFIFLTPLLYTSWGALIRYIKYYILIATFKMQIMDVVHCLWGTSYQQSPPL